MIELVVRSFVLVGLAVSILAYIYIVIEAFRKGALAGILTLLIGPIVVVFVTYLRQEKNIKKAFMVWAASTVLFIMGVVLSSGA